MLPSNQVVNGNCSISTGSHCNVSCASGYAAASTVYKCSNNPTSGLPAWVDLGNLTCSSANTSMCSLPTLPNGYAVDTSACAMNVGGSCRYYCQSGFSGSGGVVTCMSTLTWSSLSSTCTPIQTTCPLLNNTLPSDRKIVGTCGNTNMSKCNVTCGAGYYAGSTVYTCANGGWFQYPVLNCVATGACPALYTVIPVNSMVVGECGVTDGTFCNVSCKAGFASAAGSFTAYKCYNTQWINMVTSLNCVAVTNATCPALVLPTGFLSGGVCTNYNNEGSVCPVKCDVGYGGTPNPVTCFQGSWGAVGGCYPVTTNVSCSDPSLPTGFNVSSDCMHNDGSLCNVVCNADYYGVGGRIKCVNGTWAIATSTGLGNCSLICPAVCILCVCDEYDEYE